MQLEISLFCPQRFFRENISSRDSHLTIRLHLIWVPVLYLPFRLRVSGNLTVSHLDFIPEWRAEPTQLITSQRRAWGRRPRDRRGTVTVCQAEWRDELCHAELADETRALEMLRTLHAEYLTGESERGCSRSWKTLKRRADKSDACTVPTMRRQ